MTTRVPSLDPQTVFDIQQRHPQVWQQRAAARRRQTLWGLLLLALVLAAMGYTGFFELSRLWHGVGKLGWLLALMVPPASHGWLGDFGLAILQTLAMAFLGTLLASLAAVPLACLGANNLLPVWIVHFGVRRVLDGLRGVDALIWALMWINVVGLGPFAGILAIAVSDTGTLAKLYAEAIEHVERGPLEGIRAAGGNWLQVLRFGIYPQVFPVLLSHMLYYFEANTRAASILGVVGAGGIGMHLSDRIRINHWDEVSCILLLILVTVALIDMGSKALRARFSDYTSRQA